MSHSWTGLLTFQLLLLSISLHAALIEVDLAERKVESFILNGGFYTQKETPAWLSPTLFLYFPFLPQQGSGYSGSKECMNGQPPTHKCVHTATDTRTWISADAFISCSFTNICPSLSPDLVQTEETQKDKAVDLLRKCFKKPLQLIMVQNPHLMHLWFWLHYYV